MAQLDRVRDALHQQPFRPFELRLVDGRSYIVKHPDFVALPPGDRKRDIVYYDDAGVHLIDLALILDILMAGDVEPARPAAADNGG